jgi:hypothetical protein
LDYLKEVMAVLSATILPALSTIIQTDALRPKGQKVNSQAEGSPWRGRQPLVHESNPNESPNGAKVTAAPLGLTVFYLFVPRGLRRWRFTIAALRLSIAFT